MDDNKTPSADVQTPLDHTLEDNHTRSPDDKQASVIAADARPEENTPADVDFNLLVEVTHQLSAYIVDVRYWEGIQAEKGTFELLVAAMDRLAQQAGHDKTILIRYRGFPSGSREATKQDYVILFKGNQIDRNTAKAAVKRQGLAMSHLAGRLEKAFGIFAEHGIRNLYLQIPSIAPSAQAQFKTALQILARFPRAIKSDTPIKLALDGQATTVPIVKDENNQPDPNLTLVAGLNRLTAENMQALVAKVANLIQRGRTGSSAEQQATVYNAIFQIDSLKEQLVRPPLEMNNVKWQILGRGEKVVESEDLSDLEANLVLDVKDQLIRESSPTDELAETDAGEDQTGRRAQDLAEPTVAFDPHDHARLAEYFELPEEEVKTIVDLVDSCFETDGRFLRWVFEQNVPIFARNEKSVFELLWNYLKGTRKRSARVAFLSSLQLLISRLKRPKRALKILLDDFCDAKVSFSDRNAMMLSNLILRTYNKELSFEIEITPEEVLRVKDGLNSRVAEYGMWCIEGKRTRFLKKIYSIRDQITVALDPALESKGAIPLHYLLSMEREVFIFLALVQGETGYGVMRAALEIYGNPANPIYTLPESGPNLRALLQHLRTLLRGFGRMADRSDLDVFDEVISQEEQFRQLSEDLQFNQQLTKVLEWTERIKADIMTPGK
jgi:hypothetical protein